MTKLHGVVQLNYEKKEESKKERKEEKINMKQNNRLLIGLISGSLLLSGIMVNAQSNITQDQLTPEQAQQILQQRQQQLSINQAAQQATETTQSTQSTLPSLNQGLLPQIQSNTVTNSSAVASVGKTTMPNAGPEWNGDKVSKEHPFVQGPSGNESAKQVNPETIKEVLKSLDVEAELTYNDEGILMVEDYVVVWANTSLNGRHIGDVIDTTHGEGIVLGQAGEGTTDPTQVVLIANFDSENLN